LVDVVDVFHRSVEVLTVVEEAIRIGAKAVWIQEEVINEEAAARAREAGLMVVMNRCMCKEHRKLKKEAWHRNFTIIPEYAPFRFPVILCILLDMPALSHLRRLTPFYI